MPDRCDPRAEPIHFLVLERVNASRNMARYYVLSIEATLFGNTAVAGSGAGLVLRVGVGSKFFDECAGHAPATGARTLAQWIFVTIPRKCRS